MTNRYAVSTIKYETRGNEHMTAVAGNMIIVNEKTKEARYTLLTPEMIYGEIGLNHIKKVTIFDKVRNKLFTIGH